MCSCWIYLSCCSGVQGLAAVLVSLFGLSVVCVESVQGVLDFSNLVPCPCSVVVMMLHVAVMSCLVALVITLVPHSMWEIILDQFRRSPHCYFSTTLLDLVLDCICLDWCPIVVLLLPLPPLL